jgi:hypothetical protein
MTMLAPRNILYVYQVGLIYPVQLLSDAQALFSLIFNDDELQVFSLAMKPP